MKNLKAIDEKTLRVFVPMEIKKHGGMVILILPKNIYADIVISENSTNTGLFVASLAVLLGYRERLENHKMERRERHQGLKGLQIKGFVFCPLKYTNKNTNKFFCVSEKFF